MLTTGALTSPMGGSVGASVGASVGTGVEVGASVGASVGCAGSRAKRTSVDLPSSTSPWTGTAVTRSV